MLFAEADIITAVAVGIGGILSGAAAAYVLIRRARTDSQVKAEEAQAKIDAARRRDIAKEKKDSLDECWELYKEVKNENKSMARKIRRLEQAFRAAGLPLSDLDNDSDENDSGGVVPPGT